MQPAHGSGKAATTWPSAEMRLMLGQSVNASWIDRDGISSSAPAGEMKAIKVVRLAHPEKAPVPMVATESGMMMLINALHPEKAFGSMVMH